jgi:hypothetical protein
LQVIFDVFVIIFNYDIPLSLGLKFSTMFTEFDAVVLVAKVVEVG